MTNDTRLGTSPSSSRPFDKTLKYNEHTVHMSLADRISNYKRNWEYSEPATLPGLRHRFLPHELLVMAVSFLDAKSLKDASTVNNQFYDATSGYRFGKLTFQVANGYPDLPSTYPTSSEIVKDLKIRSIPTNIRTMNVIWDPHYAVETGVDDLFAIHQFLSDRVDELSLELLDHSSFATLHKWPAWLEHIKAERKRKWKRLDFPLMAPKDLITIGDSFEEVQELIITFPFTEGKVRGLSEGIDYFQGDLELRDEIPPMPEMVDLSYFSVESMNTLVKLLRQASKLQNLSLGTEKDCETFQEPPSLMNSLTRFIFIGFRKLDAAQSILENAPNLKALQLCLRRSDYEAIPHLSIPECLEELVVGGTITLRDFQTILNNAPSVRSASFKGSNNVAGTTDIDLQDYNNLRHIGFKGDGRIVQLEQFFQRAPNVDSLELHFRSLTLDGQEWLNKKVSALKSLKVELTDSRWDEGGSWVEESTRWAKELQTKKPPLFNEVQL